MSSWLQEMRQIPSSKFQMLDLLGINCPKLLL